jgi:hypothetical protein
MTDGAALGKRHETEPNGTKRHETAPNGTKRHQTEPNGTERNAFLSIFGNIPGLSLS